MLVLENVRYCMSLYYFRGRLGLLLGVNELRSLIRKCKGWLATQPEHNLSLVAWKSDRLLIPNLSTIIIKSLTLTNIFNYPVSIADAGSW